MTNMIDQTRMLMCGPVWSICRQFGKQVEDWRDCAGRRDQCKFNPGPVQVSGAESLKQEVAFIRDQQFEFAASL